MTEIAMNLCNVQTKHELTIRDMMSNDTLATGPILANRYAR